MRAIKEEIEQKLTAIELDDAWLLMEDNLRLHIVFTGKQPVLF